MIKTTFLGFLNIVRIICILYLSNFTKEEQYCSESCTVCSKSYLWTNAYFFKKQKIKPKLTFPYIYIYTLLTDFTVLRICHANSLSEKSNVQLGLGPTKIVIMVLFTFEDSIWRWKRSLLNQNFTEQELILFN